MKLAQKARSDPAKWKPQLEDLCGILSSDEEKKCLDIVDKSQELQEKEPLDYCLDAGLCRENQIDGSFNLTNVKADDDNYKICKSLVKLAKDNNAQKLWKIYVAPSCRSFGDPNFTAKCESTAGKYLEDLGKISELEFCKKLNLVDADIQHHSGHKVEGDHSVCNFLVGFANWLGYPIFWPYQFRDYCSKLDSVYGFGLCEVTVYKNMRDFQVNPGKFCRDHNLVDV